MSTFVLMRILESAPTRYDLGIGLLTLGRLGAAYDRLIGHVRRGQCVLDLGCGTGALALRAARRGATVKAIDVNPEMLEIARKRAIDAALAENIEMREMGMAELDAEHPDTYDAVTSGLCFSELSEDELRYTLRQVRRILVPSGRLLIADEVVPPGSVRRFLHGLIRIPLAAATWLITEQTTRAVRDLPAKLREAGFAIDSQRSNALGSFMEIVAKRPAAGAR